MAPSSPNLITFAPKLFYTILFRYGTVLRSSTSGFGSLKLNEVNCTSFNNMSQKY